MQKRRRVGRHHVNVVPSILVLVLLLDREDKLMLAWSFHFSKMLLLSSSIIWRVNWLSTDHFSLNRVAC
jgi:hypothetical protein